MIPTLISMGHLFMYGCVYCGSYGHLDKYVETSFKKMVNYAKERGFVRELSDTEEYYLWKTAFKESSGRPDAANGQHKGLFQKAQKLHGPAAPCPVLQLHWYVEHYLKRYGNSPKRAYQHLVSRGWQ